MSLTASLIALLLIVAVIVSGSLLWLGLTRRKRHAPNRTDRGIPAVELAEPQRAQPEQRFQAVFEQAPIGMALAGLDGRLLQVNRALSRLTGYDQEKLVGMELLGLTHPEDRAAELRGLEAMRTGRLRVYNGERRYLHAAGHPLWVAVYCSMIQDDAGAPSQFLVQVQDVSSRRDYDSQLNHMAEHDPLTGLLNRRAFERILSEHVVRGERYGHSGAVMVLDLDHFKQVNEALGHSAGDELIMRVAKVLATTLRKSDAIARLGGDEFGILLPGGGTADAERTAVRLHRALAAERPMQTSDGAPATLKASIGIAPLSESVELTSEEALINADLAMYDAKEAGRSTTRLYDGSMRGQARIEARLGWIKRIRAAIDEDGLTLHAQPVLELASGQAVQHELLVRMVDAHGDLIMPQSFLPLADRFGLIRAIDRWVITRTITLLGEQRALGTELTVEINISGQSLGDWELGELIERGLISQSVDPSQLIFEITEAAAVSNVAHARRFAEQLKELGCRFALDDFGSGFGSFFYVKHLPIDFLKISSEFVRNCSTDATDRMVIAAIVDLAQGLGKRTIAERVGDQQTLETLQGLGVDLGQGFYLGRPTPLSSWLGTPSVQETT